MSGGGGGENTESAAALAALDQRLTNLIYRLYGVTSVPNTVVPVITLVGEPIIEFVVFVPNLPGEAYSDPGATAFAGDVDLTSSIVTTSNVEVSVVGTYFVHYNVSFLGNSATQVSRTVIIADVPF